VITAEMKEAVKMQKKSEKVAVDEGLDPELMIA